MADKGKTVLVVEDEADLGELVCFNLDREGYTYRRATDGSGALVDIRRNPPDMIILDRMLPGRSGDEVLSELRRDPRTASIPVIMLTAKAEESDQIQGFSLGADDYVPKPFSMKVLMARVAAVFRRAESEANDPAVMTQGPITIDKSRYEVLIDGSPISLTTTEFRILRTLMAAGGRVLDRAQLINMVLGPMVAVTDRTIDVHIAAVRKKLGSAAGWIQTVRGVGYTFRPPVQTHAGR